jgi:hypothetical protein
VTEIAFRFVLSAPTDTIKQYLCVLAFREESNQG